MLCSVAAFTVVVVACFVAFVAFTVVVVAAEFQYFRHESVRNGDVGETEHDSLSGR